MTSVAERPAPDRVGRGSSPSVIWWYVATIALGTVLFFAAALRQPFNQNEIQQMAPYGSNDIGEIVGATRQPPLDPLAGALVQHLFGMGQWQQRLVPTLAGVGTLVVLSLLLVRLGLGRVGAFAILALAISPLMIRFAAYTRPYSTPVFLICLFIYACQRWLLDRRPRWLVLAAATAVALFLTRIPEPAVFLAVTAAVLAWFALRRRVSWAAAWPIITICAGALLVVGLPMSRLLAEQAAMYANEEGIAARIDPGLHHLTTTVLPLMSDWLPWWPLTAAMVLVVLALGDSRRWLFGQWAWWPSLAAPVVWIIAYLFVSGVDLEAVPYRPRYLYFFLPAFFFVVAALARTVVRMRGPHRALSMGLAWLLAACLIGQLPAAATVVTEDEDPDFGLAAEVLKERVPDNAIVLYDNPNPIGRYHHPFLGVPRYMGQTPRVLPLTTVSKTPRAVPDSGPVYLLLLDRKYGATLFRHPEKTWTADVAGWVSEPHGRFVLYRPTKGQSGKDGVIEAGKEFGQALGPSVGFPESRAAVSVLATTGNREDVYAQLDDMYARADPTDDTTREAIRSVGSHIDWKPDD